MTGAVRAGRAPARLAVAGNRLWVGDDDARTLTAIDRRLRHGDACRGPRRLPERHRRRGRAALGRGWRAWLGHRGQARPRHSAAPHRRGRRVAVAQRPGHRRPVGRRRRRRPGLGDRRDSQADRDRPRARAGHAQDRRRRSRRRGRGGGRQRLGAQRAAGQRDADRPADRPRHRPHQPGEPPRSHLAVSHADRCRRRSAVGPQRQHRKHLPHRSRPAWRGRDDPRRAGAHAAAHRRGSPGGVGRDAGRHAGADRSADERRAHHDCGALAAGRRCRRRPGVGEYRDRSRRERRRRRGHRHRRPGACRARLVLLARVPRPGPRPEPSRRRRPRAAGPVRIHRDPDVAGNALLHARAWVPRGPVRPRPAAVRPRRADAPRSRAARRQVRDDREGARPRIGASSAWWGRSRPAVQPCSSRTSTARPADRSPW